MDIITVQDQRVEYKFKVKFANLLSERLKAVIKKNLVHFWAALTLTFEKSSSQIHVMK